TNGENAANVLGQSNFTNNTSGTASQSVMSLPTDVTLDSANSLLFVADADNNRVLVYDVSSISDGMNASNVLGQSNFTSRGAATTQAGMDSPEGVAYDSA